MKGLLMSTSDNLGSNVGRFCEAAESVAKSPIATGVQRVGLRARFSSDSIRRTRLHRIGRQRLRVVGGALMISLLALAVTGGAVADDSALAGRKILAKNQDAVVTVRLVVSYNVSYGGRDQQSESKTEAVGTVIDPGGLTVISLTTIDPSAMMKTRQRATPQELKVETEVKDVKIVLADDTELPAEIVLRDKDLDLAYLRPTEKPAKPLSALDLARSGQPQVLDEVVCLNRLGKIANRVVTVSLERVDALVTKPRPFYVLSPGGSSGIGSPVFALTGAPLGIVLIRNGSTGGEANAASLFSGSGGAGYMPVIVPGADILDDAKQALEAKKPVADK